MRPTIRDVAREAGVSISTVSRVLNNTCPVSADKRRRVEETVARMGYTPDPTARSLLKRETGGVGVLVPYVSEEFFSEFLTGVDRHAQENGYYLLISASHRNRSEFDKALLSMYGRVDGLIVMAPDEGNYDASYPPLQEMPVVYVNTAEHQGKDVVRVDNYTGFFDVTNHLIASGHRAIAMITGPDGSFDAGERLRGFKDAMTGAGLDVRDDFLTRGDFTLKSGYQAVDTLMRKRPLPTAIAAANDLSALGALSALHERGFQVPDSIALTGFDDVPSARYATPPLTTVHVPIRELGSRAVARLIERVTAGTKISDTVVDLPVELVVRASSSKAAVKTNGRN